MLTAIFGGTFNPFHIGHYEILKALNKDSQIEKILLMPDRLPPHKSCEFLADDRTRIEMCRIAAKDFSKCELCLIEFEREGKSYTYDTVKQLKKRYPDTEFAFVMGGDMLIFFDKWHNYMELMTELSFIVFRRADIDETEFLNSINRYANMGMKIILKNEVIPAVSSTELRRSFSSAKSLIPPEIYDYLKKRGVYGAG
ncbi:MAG: nicotinate (nicotinamide) nucleotide adenylyltransferase [Acutalibacteraceae bacterium]|jgi:nicotinate-nucleotide adenylyltransferase